PHFIDHQFEKLLFRFLSDKRKCMYPTRVVHHPAVYHPPVYHPATTRMFHGDDISISSYTTPGYTTPAYAESIQEPFTINNEVLKAIFTPELTYLFESQGRILGRFLGVKNQYVLKRLYQFWQILVLSKYVEANDIHKIKNMLEIEGHRLVYFELRSWFRDIANFSQRNDVCPIHIAIVKQNPVMMRYLTSHGALLEKVHIELMSPLLVETVVDDFMDAHLNLSDVATKYHPQTICSMRNLQNSNKLILDTVLKKSDWAQLIL